jgi:hypothetical protein
MERLVLLSHNCDTERVIVSSPVPCGHPKVDLIQQPHAWMATRFRITNLLDLRLVVPFLSRLVPASCYLKSSREKSTLSKLSSKLVVVLSKFVEGEVKKPENNSMTNCYSVI